MFFLLSKLTGFLASPLLWVLVLLLWGLLVRPSRRKRRLLRTGTVLLWLLSNDWLSNAVMYSWNERAVQVASLGPSRGCAVVLGGFTIQNQVPTDRVYLNQAADRLMHAVQLYRQGKVGYILISGGNGSLRQSHETEAENARQLLRLCQVPDAAILLEGQSQNTHQNAQRTKALLQQRGMLGTRHILITSAWHMARAKGCFDTEGIATIAFPTDFRAYPPSLRLDAILIPSLESVHRWDVLLHEWLGLAVYWAQGYV